MSLLQTFNGIFSMRILQFLSLTLMCLTPSFTAAEEATVFKQNDVPLTIVSYRNRYQPPDRVGDGTVVHQVTVANNSSERVSAYGLGFYIFDTFKRDMGRPFIGYAMNSVDVDAQDFPGWEQRPNNAFLFEGHGHGLAYVAIVRFEDGTVWRADNSEISRQLSDFEFQLSSDQQDE